MLHINLGNNKGLANKMSPQNCTFKPDFNQSEKNPFTWKIHPV